MGMRDAAPQGSSVGVNDEVVSGAISPLPPNSSELGELVPAPAGGALPQVLVACEVAASAAKSAGENFHHAAPGGAAGKKPADEPPAAWRLSPGEEEEGARRMSLPRVACQFCDIV